MAEILIDALSSTPIEVSLDSVEFEISLDATPILESSIVTRLEKAIAEANAYTDTKANANDVYTREETNNLINQVLNGDGTNPGVTTPITVDSVLDVNSTNAIQNRAVKQALDTKANAADVYAKTDVDNKISSAVNPVVERVTLLENSPSVPTDLVDKVDANAQAIAEANSNLTDLNNELSQLRTEVENGSSRVLPPSNASKEMMYPIIMSYVGNDEIVFKDGGNNSMFETVCVRNTDGKFQMKCSNLVSAVLMGIPYEKSRYVLGSDSENILGEKAITLPKSGDPLLTHGSLRSYELAEFFHKNGSLFEDGFDRVEFGDILFYKDDSKTDRFMHIVHCSLVLAIIRGTGQCVVAECSASESQYEQTSCHIKTMFLNAKNLRCFARPNYGYDGSCSSYTLSPCFQIARDSRDGIGGELLPSSYCMATEEYIPFVKGDSIAYVGAKSDESGYKYMVRINEYDEDYSNIKYTTFLYNGNLYDIDVSADTRYIRITFGRSDSTKRTIHLNDVRDFGVKIDRYATKEALSELTEIREQLTDLNDDLSQVNSRLSESMTDIEKAVFGTSAQNILNTFGTFASKTSAGIECVWDDVEKAYTLNGTSTSAFNNNIYYDANHLPASVELGNDYILEFTSTSRDVYFQVGISTNGSFAWTDVFDREKIFVPENCIGIAIRVHMLANRTVNQTRISNIKFYMCEEPTIGLEQKVKNIEDQTSILEDDVTNLQKERDSFADEDFTYISRSVNGVTFTWENDNNRCKVQGTSTGMAVTYLVNNNSAIPLKIETGKRYFVDFDTTDENILLEILVYNSSSSGSKSYKMHKKGYINIESDAIGLIIRIRVISGKTANGYISRIKFLNTISYDAMNDITDKGILPLMVTFIDDDTSGQAYVDRYYNACKHNGITGNYAVMTKHIEDGDVSAESLLRYEDEGFNMLLHCYYQYYGDTPYWIAETSDTDLMRENLAKGIRQMNQYGFASDFKNWVTPGGRLDDVMVYLAKYFGFNTLITTGDGYHNTVEDDNRYHIKRCSIDATDSGASLAAAKAHVLDLKNDAFGGWLIITTHFNSGWSDLTWNTALDANGYPIGYTRFNELVQYVKDQGCKVVSFAEGVDYFKHRFAN